MTEEELTQHLEAAEYVFAKTMPQIPHWYTQRKNWKDDGLFQECVQAIRDLGEVRPWPAPPEKPKYHNTYFDAGEWSYWTGGLPREMWINRAKTYKPQAGRRPPRSKRKKKPEAPSTRNTESKKPDEAKQSAGSGEVKGGVEPASSTESRFNVDTEMAPEELTQDTIRRKTR